MAKTIEQVQVTKDSVVERWLEITGMGAKDLMALCDIQNYIHGKVDFDDEFYIVTISRHPHTTNLLTKK